MAIKMSQFVLDNTFSVLVNFPSRIKGVVNNSSSGYVLDRKFIDKKNDFLNWFLITIFLNKENNVFWFL